MGKNDIRDNRTVQKEMDISLTSPQSIERLLRYIGLKEGELPIHEMDQILNGQRIENQGQKIAQSKLKKMMLPQRKFFLTYFYLFSRDGHN